MPGPALSSPPPEALVYSSPVEAPVGSLPRLASVGKRVTLSTALRVALGRVRLLSMALGA